MPYLCVVMHLKITIINRDKDEFIWKSRQSAALNPCLN
jgi:hypothetical protein